MMVDVRIMLTLGRRILTGKRCWKCSVPFFLHSSVQALLRYNWHIKRCSISWTFVFYSAVHINLMHFTIWILYLGPSSHFRAPRALADLLGAHANPQSHWWRILSQEKVLISLEKFSLTEVAARQGGREGLMESDCLGAWCVKSFR